MDSAASFLRASGRIAPGRFMLAITGVYLLSFLSQVLLAAPIVARANVIPFLAVQVVTIWSWYVLHARRLHDAGRGTGMVVAITILYALGIVLLLLIVTLLAAVAPAQPSDTDPVSGGTLELILIFYVISQIIDDPGGLDIFGYAMLSIVALIVLPMLISVIFSAWAALRPRAATPA